MDGKRRDSREEPGDAPPRVDVFSKERPTHAGALSPDAAANAVIALRRELSRLNSQAAAVERSLDANRKERSVALEQLERETARAVEVEARLVVMESELDAVKRLHATAVEELARVRQDRAELLQSIEQSKSAAAATDDSKHAAELSEVRQRLEEQISALSEARAKNEKLEKSLSDARAAAKEARDAAITLAGDAESDRVLFCDRIAALERDLANARARADAFEAKARRAKERVGAVSEAQASFAQSLVSLKEQVSAAFSRLESMAPPPVDTHGSGEMEAVPVPRLAPPPRIEGAATHIIDPLDDRANATTTAPPAPTRVSEAARSTAKPLAGPPVKPDIMTVQPPGVVFATRDALIADLSEQDEATVARALAKLRADPDWLVGTPPAVLMSALADIDYDTESPIFEIARMWDRVAMCGSLLTRVAEPGEPRLREHDAWLVQHLGLPSEWEAISALALNTSDTPQVRRWMLKALERFAAARSTGWSELSSLVGTLSLDSDPGVRDAVVDLVAALPKTEEKVRSLLAVLRTDDNEIVLAGAVSALASILPLELDPAVIDRLLGHPSKRVQEAVRDLVERAKRAPRPSLVPRARKSLIPTA